MSVKQFFYTAILALFCNITVYGSVIYNQSPIAKNGVLDLREQSFSEKIELKGQWNFYWRQLSSGKNQATVKPRLINFPSVWNNYVINGKELPAFGYATYELTVLLPKTVPPLSIAMPDSYSAYRFYINGREGAADGKVSTSAKGFVPYWQYKSVDIPPHTDTLRIMWQVANFVHSKGGVKDPIVIGKKYDIELNRMQVGAIDLLLTGCLFMGGLFFLGLYLFGKKDKAILLFALYSLDYCYRMMGSGNYLLHTILPDMDWYITVRLEYITLFMGIGLFGMYTRYLYPEDTNKWVANIICGICFIFTAASLILPPFYFTQLINPFLFIALYCLLYIPYVYINAYKRGRPGSVYAFLSSLALMTVFAISLLHYWTIIPQMPLFSFIGYISFFFLQSLVLSHRVSFALNNAKDQAEQGLVAKSEFLSTMSHEIRTPLNSVIGMSHLLQINNPRPDQMEQLNVIIFSANNLLGIVNDILDYNKIEAGMITFEKIEMDITSISRNVVNSLQTSAQDKDIELKLSADGALQNKIYGDPVRTSQVITNLVHNAIKFTKTGYVMLTITVLEQTESTVTLDVQVKDTGIGISKEKQELIFERFTQADSSTSRGFGGTGLGLAISKRILELQNSSLQLISKEGEGSTFFFVQTFEKSKKTLDRHNKQSISPPAEDKQFNGVHILLVEDNPLNVMVARTFLQRWGATIDVAVNGQDALDKLDTTRHGLILMDLNMPVMDGYEAARQMRAAGVTMPIIALTANLPQEIEERVKQTGINDIVVKPFLPDELYRKVLLQLS